MLEQLAVRIPVYVGPREREAIAGDIDADRLRTKTGRHPAPILVNRREFCHPDREGHRHCHVAFNLSST
jgi:hypothetical protein